MYQTPQQDVEAKFMEKALVRQLRLSLKEHLIKALDAELEQICEEAVKKHVQVALLSRQDQDAYSRSQINNYYFSFVQNVVNTVTAPSIVLNKAKQ